VSKQTTRETKRLMTLFLNLATLTSSMRASLSEDCFYLQPPPTPPMGMVGEGGGGRTVSINSTSPLPLYGNDVQEISSFLSLSLFRPCSISSCQLLLVYFSAFLVHSPAFFFQERLNFFLSRMRWA